MFNGYVWQTRTLEVRPDRLPNDFDLATAPPLGKLPVSQTLPYASTATVSSTYSYAMPAPQATPASTVLSASSLAAPMAHNALSLTQQSLSGNPANSVALPDAMVYPDSTRSTLLGDISRSPTAFKVSSASSKPTALPDVLGSSAQTSGFGQNGLPASTTTSHDASSRVVHIPNVGRLFCSVCKY